MKIAVTGKGGVGKDNFLQQHLPDYMQMKGKQVLAADVDPDANLGLALGFDEETLDSIVPISKMRKLVEENVQGLQPESVLYTESESRRHSGDLW